MTKRIDVAQQKLSEIKTIHTEARSVGRNINNKKKQIQSLLDQSDDFILQRKNILQEYRAEQRKINKTLKAAETFYTEYFQPLQSKISDKKTGLKKALSEADSFRNELIRRKERIVEVNSEFQSTLRQLRSKAISIKRIEKTAFDHEKSIDSVLKKTSKNLTITENHVTSMRDNLKTSKDLHREIESILKGSKDHLKIIVNIQKQSEISRDKINVFLEEANETNDKISDLYEIVTNKTMAGAFDERRKTLSTELDKWYGRVRILSIFWFLLIIIIFGVQMYGNGWSVNGLSYKFYLRFLYTAPIAYYLFFCVGQFGTIRKSHECYAFKTTIALSIEAHTELLRRNFDLGTYEKDILDFSLESLRKIYDEPFYSERARENVDLRKQESKGEKRSFSLLRLWGNKDQELIKVLDKIVDRTIPKNS
jgi:hypothetical protein